MRKFIIGMIAVLGVHIVFVAFFATLDTVESDRNARSLATPTAIPPTNEPARPDEIVVARGTTTESPATARSVVASPSPIPTVESHTNATDARIVKPIKPTPKRVVPVYQAAAYRIERTEFPQNMTFAASDDNRSGFSATTKKTGKRSFLSKVGSIVKKPYDGLKAVAAWLR